MKKNMQKMFLILLMLFTLIIGVKNVEAIEIKDVKTIGYKKYIYNNKNIINKVIYFRADSDTAYCVELGKNFSHSINAGTADKVETLEAFLGRSNADKTVYVPAGKRTASMKRQDYINLVAYYGDSLAKSMGGTSYYTNIAARKYYLAAQALIWKQTSPTVTLGGIYGTYNYSTNKLTNYKDLSQEIDTIKSNIVNYYEKPSFCETTEDLKLASDNTSGTTHTFTDNNRILSNYTLAISSNNTGGTCSIGGNSINCSSLNVDTNTNTSAMTLTLSRKQIGSNATKILSRNYSATYGQKIMTIGKTPEIKCTVKINVTKASVEPVTIKIKKVDADQNNIAGVNFKVCQANYDSTKDYEPIEDKNGHYVTYPNDSSKCITTTGGTNTTNGEITLPNPYSSTYTTDFTASDNKAICYYEVADTNVNGNYIIRDYPVCNVINKNITRTFVNYSKPIYGNIVIHKVDNNSKNIGGATFAIYDKENNFIEEIESNDEGTATSKPISFGNYYLVETSAPDGYIVNSNKKYYFKIETYDQQATLYSDVDLTKAVTDNKITNDPENASIKIIKTAGDTKKGLKDVKFEIYKITEIVNGDAGINEEATTTEDTEVTDSVLNPESKELIKTVITDENGIATIEELKYGTYRIVETETGKEYLLKEEPTEIAINENKTYEVSITNEKVSKTADVKVVLIITLGLCALTIAIIAYIKRNQIIRNNAI